MVRFGINLIGDSYQAIVYYVLSICFGHLDMKVTSSLLTTGVLFITAANWVEHNTYFKNPFRFRKTYDNNDTEPMSIRQILTFHLHKR